jgi:threonine synthase
VCSRTGVVAPLDEPSFLSPAGAPWLVRYRLDRQKGEILRRRLADRPWSLWRYRELLPLRDFTQRVDLGAGGTPLIRLGTAVSAGLSVWYKQEAGNPAGSFKARGLSLAVNRARELGAPGVQIPSAGNAALALATYAGAAGLPCRVAMPEDTPRTLVERCSDLGAEVRVGGATLVDSAAILRRADDGYWTLSTLQEPYRLEGKKTMGYELFEQFEGRLPDWIIYPTGGGTGLIGMAKAFDELEALGWIGPERPRLVAVQMQGCAPIVRAFQGGATEATPWEHPETAVWGLRVPRAIGDFLILRAVRRTDGTAVAVPESAIEPTRARLERDEGMVIGPEGAACYVALEALIQRQRIQSGERVVLFQTGDPKNYV